LRDWDNGRWAGRRLDDLQAEEPEALAAWLSDPDAAPHGGESLSALCRRVAAWLAACNRQEGRMIAVTHQPVIRAAIVSVLDAPLRSFWRIDVAPLSIADLRGDGVRWRLRLDALSRDRTHPISSSRDPALSRSSSRDRA
jgi:broad specificity phosphatase PhoE